MTSRQVFPYTCAFASSVALRCARGVFCVRCSSLKYSDCLVGLKKNAYCFPAVLPVNIEVSACQFLARACGDHTAAAFLFRSAKVEDCALQLSRSCGHRLSGKPRKSERVLYCELQLWSFAFQLNDSLVCALVAVWPVAWCAVHLDHSLCTETFCEQEKERIFIVCTHRTVSYTRHVRSR